MNCRSSDKQYILSDEDMHSLHKTELELLDEFSRICKKYKINYSIDGGTLLGAVRHGGLIPWDDDADVIMLRSEYNKLKAVCKKELNSAEFYFQDMDNTEGYRWGYGKLRKKNTRFVRLGQEHMPYEQGIFMDIFPCDYVPDNYLMRCICNFHCYIYRKIFWSAVGRKYSEGIKKYIFKLLYKIPEKNLKKSFNRYVHFRNKKPTKTVKCLTFPACNRTYGYKKEWYVDTCDLQFEGKIFKGSKKYDEYLKFLYGDYNKLPPENDRKVHPVSEFYCSK